MKEATCNLCGQRWARDPRLEVPCPDCGAQVGQYCRRPSAHRGNFVEFHVAREQLAVDRGFLTRECPGRSVRARVAQQAPLFAAAGGDCLSARE